MNVGRANDCRRVQKALPRSHWDMVCASGDYRAHRDPFLHATMAAVFVCSPQNLLRGNFKAVTVSQCSSYITGSGTIGIFSRVTIVYRDLLYLDSKCSLSARLR